MGQQMKNAVVDDHVKNPAGDPPQQRKKLLFDREQRAQSDEKHDIEIDIQRVEHPLGDDFGNQQNIRHFDPPFFLSSDPPQTGGV